MASRTYLVLVSESGTRFSVAHSVHPHGDLGYQVLKRHLNLDRALELINGLALRWGATMYGHTPKPFFEMPEEWKKGYRCRSETQACFCSLCEDPA